MPRYPRADDQPGGAISPFLLWLLICGLLIGSHFPLYFQQAHYEHGDLAANALQIREAKAFREIYGNYSRFGFHHPGPAFFYVYAAGETFLHDKLKLLPAPYNAHVITGFLLQGLFFTWAVAIVARRTQRPLVIPLLLFFAAIHFGTVNFFQNNAAFHSIWSPHVLLMPFLCLLVAGASLAAGGTRDLVPLVLAACFLVHGHVAQPLFVLPLVALSYVAWSWRHMQRGSFRTALMAAVSSHAFAAAIIVIFLLPIVLDILKGEQSNLRAILHHFASHSADRKTFAQSALYFVAFLCHVEPQNFCDHLTSESFEFLRQRWYLLAMWALIGAGAGALLIWNKRRRSLPDVSFALWLAIYFAAATALTLVWGMLQNGPMAGFNSFFNFAILFVPFILLAIALASPPGFESASFLARFLFTASLPFFVFASRNFSLAPYFPTQTSSSADLHQQIRRAALEDPNPARTKLLLFAHEDWPEATRVALALERLRYKFRVPAEWEFMFGKNTGINVLSALKNDKLAIWRVRSAGSGPNWVLNSPTEIDPRHSEILFSSPQVNAQDFFASGWDISDGPFSWSVARSAVLRFTARPATSDVEIICEVLPSSESQRMIVTFNDGPFRSFQITHPTEAVLHIPLEAWNARPVATLKFELPDALSPLARGSSTDPRELGVGFVRIRFRQASTTDR